MMGRVWDVGRGWCWSMRMDSIAGMDRLAAQMFGLRVRRRRSFGGLVSRRSVCIRWRLGRLPRVKRRISRDMSRMNCEEWVSEERNFREYTARVEIRVRCVGNSNGYLTSLRCGLQLYVCTERKGRHGTGAAKTRERITFISSINHQRQNE